MLCNCIYISQIIEDNINHYTVLVYVVIKILQLTMYMHINIIKYNIIHRLAQY